MLHLRADSIIFYFNFTMRCLFLFLLLFSGAAYAQSTTTGLKPDQKLSILDNKAFFLFPAAAVNIARQPDIMAASPDAAAETRIVMDIGEKRIVFFAEELYTTVGDNLATGMRSNLGKDYIVKELKRTDGLVAVLSTPQIFDSSQNAILINSLIVKTLDKTMFRINAFINPKAFADRDQFRELSERVFSSLSKGWRVLNTKARTQVVAVLNARKMLHVDLPEGYIISKDGQYDFEVLHFRKIKDFFDTTQVSLSVYLGHYPTYFYSDYGFSKNQKEKAAGIFLGKNRDWMLFKNEEQHIFLKEQQFPAGDLEEALVLHVAMTADRMMAIEELDGIVSTIKFADQ